MIGPPGIGKSMLAQGMAELLPKEELEDVLIFSNAEDENTPLVRTYRTGKGKAIVASFREEAKKVDSFRKFIFYILLFSLVFITAYYFFIWFQSPHLVEKIIHGRSRISYSIPYVFQYGDYIFI